MTDPQVLCQGLSREEAARRLGQGQGNGVTHRVSRTEGQIILSNTLTFFNLVFVVLAVLLSLSGSSVKNMTFMIVVVFNAVIGCFQEIRAKRAVDKLTLVAAQVLPTLRDGVLTPVRSDLLVLGDAVRFSAGDQICADGTLLTGKLLVNEALITGEADPIEKNPGDTLLSGSFVVSGSGLCRLTAVGNDAFAARLAAEAKADPRAAKSEMMRSLDKLIRVVGIVLVPVGFLLFYQQYKLLDLGLRAGMEATVAALVGMIPEGLYLLTSIAVAASCLKLSRQQVLVQDMNCIETLARVDVLCVDKTGTITQPDMAVEKLVPLNDSPTAYIEKILASLYTDQAGENDTAKALAAAFARKDIWQSAGRIPFTAETKWSGAEFAGEGAFVAGAPELLLKDRFGLVSEAVENCAAQGYRVLLLARYEDALQPILDPEKVTPLALVLLHNPIRPDAAKTFRYFAAQGVRVKVISGDNPLTASQIAQKAGIENADRYIDATTLEKEQDFLDAAGRYTVFGRVTPDKKRRLIKALKKLGHTVAMTGDGVNDVLAMKESDCGIAMASGAQAACQVARLVLLASDFSAMPGIVGEGRRVINNIQRSAALFLVKNIFSLGLSLLTLIAGMPYPMIPLHLTVISATTIGIPSFFLAMEPNYAPIRGRFLPGVLRRALPGGLTNICAVLVAQSCMGAFSLPLSQVNTVCTAALAVVGLTVLFQVSKPFDTFRKILWWAMTAALILCFTLLGDLFGLRWESTAALAVTAGLGVLSPGVYFLAGRLLRRGEKLFH